MTFLINFLKALAESLGAKAAPFALAEAQALIAIGIAYARATLSSWTDEEKKLLKDAVAADLRDFITACKEEGKDLQTDIIGILFSAGGNSVLADFGFNQTTATIASNE